MENQEFVTQRNPLEYLKVFFRRKWFFVTPAFLGLVIGIVACFLLPPTYESSTVIMVQEEKIINPLIQGVAVSSPVAQRMRVLKEQLLSWNSLVALTKKLDLDADVKSQQQYEDLILGLRKNITVSMRGSNFIKISYFDKNPQRTQLVAKTLTDVLIEENMRSQTQEADVAINFITEQLEVYKRKIKESEIAQMEDQLKKLLLDSTEQHPLVKELRQKIDSAKKVLESGEFSVAPTGQSVTTPVQEALQKEIDNLIQQGESTGGSSVAYAANTDTGATSDPNPTIYKLMLMDKLDTSMARDIGVNENIYNMLLKKLETAKITQRLETSKEGTRYVVIDPPRLPLRPSKPNKALVLFLGLFLGSVSGAGLVLGREFMDHSFLDIEDAKDNLELPVLGAISRLTTQEEIDREKYRQKKLIGIALSSSVVVIFISALIAFLRK